MRDALNRGINYLRLSITDRCNLRCSYCMPEQGVCKQAHGAILRNEEFVKIATAMVKLGVEKIRLTGGEPLVRRGVASLLYDLNALQGIREVTLTTNGTLLADQLPDLVQAGLKRINISLDSLNPHTYSALTRGGNLSDALRGIESAKELGLDPIKLNVVLIKGVNTEEIEDFLQLAETGVEVRFIELMPIGEAASWSKEQFVDVSRLVGEREDLVPVLKHGHGGPCRYFKRVGGKGIVGIINPLSAHFCGECNRVRVTSDGMLRTCLHSNEDVDLKPFLRSDFEHVQHPNWVAKPVMSLETAILQAVSIKPERHRILEAGQPLVERNMNRIGG